MNEKQEGDLYLLKFASDYWRDSLTIRLTDRLMFASPATKKMMAIH